MVTPLAGAVNGGTGWTSNPVMPRLALPAILLLAAVLRLWRLEQNGFGNEYYAAGVRSMSTGWHNFLYHAFDPAGFVSVDKPPIAMWVQVASVKLFGFHGLSVLVPQALEGIAAVALLFHLVRRRFGAPAALLAALFLALTPVTVAVDRSSNAESCLVLVLLLAAWVVSRAAEDGSRGWLVLAMALVGLAFNVKMLAAFVVLPTFALVYGLGAPATRGRRLADLALGVVVLLVVSLAWVAFYDLTPADRRPYAGTTDSNSIAELVVGPYGIGRFVKQPRLAAIPSLESDPEAGSRASEAPAAAPASRRAQQVDATMPRRAGRLFVSAPAGPLRLADGQLAGQVAWLLPVALAGTALGALAAPWRRPLDPAHLALVLWSGWALTYAAVYSAAGGFFHFHYLAAMAPPLAALAGVGAVALWEHAVDRGWRGLLAPAALLATAAWQLHIDASALGDQPGWQRWLHVGLFGGTLFAVGWLLVTWAQPAWRPRALTTGALSLGLVVLLLMPVAWTLSVVLVPVNGILPSADLGRLLSGEAAARARARAATATNVAKLIEFLSANRADERYLLAASTTMLAAPIIIQTGEPVMARGGFHGLDPILTPDKLAALVATRQVRFVMLDDLSFVSRRLGAETAGRPIAEWVRANGTPVNPARWRAVADRRSRMQLYDLRPGAGYRVGATAGTPGGAAAD
jgi:4-amino-4-deoxy-L-arabinose transferase-like glycosyltransferase